MIIILNDELSYLVRKILFQEEILILILQMSTKDFSEEQYF